MDLAELTKMYNFEGKTIVLTGGAGILGGEIACALVGCGANVALLDREPVLAERLKPRFEQVSGNAMIAFADVLKPDTLHEACNNVLKVFGRIDCLINAAGGNKAEATTGDTRSFFDIPEDALRFVFELNMLGTILPCRIFARKMADQKEGVILNISSMSAFRPLTRVLGYSAAKAGVSNFTQWLAVHLAQEYSPRLRVNAVAPGFFLTDQNRYLLTEKETGELTARGTAIINHTPMARFGQPEDLFGAVMWLLSPASAFVTGIVVPVDGGFSAFSGV
jgi:NAD(P)-dependent dehydrogenase (short-subunit alcohol dehydrogenase family)